jgi:hypothetical protein
MPECNGRHPHPVVRYEILVYLTIKGLHSHWKACPGSLLSINGLEWSARLGLNRIQQDRSFSSQIAHETSDDLFYLQPECCELFSSNKKDNNKIRPSTIY